MNFTAHPNWASVKTGGIGRNWIVSEHQTAELSGWAVQRAIPLHRNDTAGDHAVNWKRRRQFCDSILPIPSQFRTFSGQPYGLPGTHPNGFFQLSVNPAQWRVLIFGIEMITYADRTVSESHSSRNDVNLPRGALRAASKLRSTKRGLASGRRSRYLIASCLYPVRSRFIPSFAHLTSSCKKMIEQAFLAPLMAAVSTALLAATTIVLAAGWAAIAVPAVAVGADEKDGPGSPGRHTWIGSGDPRRATPEERAGLVFATLPDLWSRGAFRQYFPTRSFAKVSSLHDQSGNAA